MLKHYASKLQMGYVNVHIHVNDHKCSAQGYGMPHNKCTLFMASISARSTYTYPSIHANVHGR